MRAKVFILLVHGSPPMGVMVQQHLSKSAICCPAPRLASIVQVYSGGRNFGREELLCQNFCHPPSNHCTDVLLPVQTPLRVKAWEKALRRHPNTAFVRYVISGLRNGFRIGFNHSSPLRSAAKNMEPAHQHPEIISPTCCQFSYSVHGFGGGHCRLPQG